MLSFNGVGLVVHVGNIDDGSSNLADRAKIGLCVHSFGELGSLSNALV